MLPERDVSFSTVGCVVVVGGQ